MRARVNPAKCQGHALCNRIAPELFRIRSEDGHSYVEHATVPTEYEERAHRAAVGCPEGAIAIKHDKEQEKE